MPRTAEHAGFGIRQIPGHLQDPRFIRIGRDAGDGDAPCGQINQLIHENAPNGAARDLDIEV